MSKFVLGSLFCFSISNFGTLALPEDQDPESLIQQLKILKAERDALLATQMAPYPVSLDSFYDPLTAKDSGATTPLELTESGIHLNFRLFLGKDSGQQLGTLFELKNNQGYRIAGAGFQDSSGTRVMANNRMLSVLIQTEAQDLKTQNIGKPFSDIAPHLITLDNQLIALSPFEPIPPKYYDFDTQTWKPWTPLGKIPLPLSFSGGQIIQGEKLLFFRNKVLYGNREVFAIDPNYTCLFAFHDNKLLVYQEPQPDLQLPSALLSCECLLTIPTSRCDSACIPIPTTFVTSMPLAFFYHQNDMLIAPSFGGLFQTQGTDITPVFKTHGQSFQLYAFLRFFDQVLIGQYPSGSLFMYNGTYLAPVIPRIPIPDTACPYQRETQTLTFYRGMVFAGLWPWGEIWSYIPYRNVWQYHGRLFTDPAMSPDIETPYWNECQAHKIEINRWGQRIISLVPLHDALFASTSNKNRDLANMIHLPPKVINQYGAVWMLRLPHQVTRQIRWQSVTDISIHITASTLKVIQDERIFIEKNLTPPFLLTPGTYSLVLGTGMYGSSEVPINLISPISLTYQNTLKKK